MRRTGESILNRLGLAPAAGLALAVAGLAGPAAADDDAVTFRFAPPEGTHYVLDLKTTTIKELAGVGRQSSEMESRTDFTIGRTEAGYDVTARPLSVKLTRDGRVVSDPVLDALQEVVTVLRLDPSGQLLSVEGYDGLLDQLGDRFPQAVIEALTPALNSDALVSQEKAEWEGRIGAFLGRTVAIGEVLHGTTTVPVSGGRELECKVETRIAGRVPCGEASCVRIASAYRDSTPDSEDAEETDPVKVVGASERLIDPATMLIFSESLERTTEASREVHGLGRVQATTVERREYRYDYQ